MKSPSEIDPPLGPEDWALIDAYVKHVEDYFTQSPRSNSVNFTTDRDDRMSWRHFNEIVRRIRGAGWQVSQKHSMLLIERPPLGEAATWARLKVGEAATNLVTLVELAAVTPIDAVSDMYLDDLGLERLLTMHRLGARFAPDLRLLTSEKGAKHLSKLFVTDALAEIGCAQGEARKVTAKGHEGRFFLLSDEVLTIGGSLNNLNVNERATRGPDAGERVEFDSRWSSASPL